MTGKSHDTELVLGRLKDFQRRTAEYVFRRFYTDPETTDRFLVADEVGLGKTLVARGVIALAIEHLLAEKVDRVDIVYVCSNMSIASQNIHRLNVSGEQKFARPTRLSLLPIDISDIRKNCVNYVSLTPGTSFDPRSRDGKVEERALIHFLLKGRLGISPAGLRRLLQCRVSDEKWEKWTHKKPESLDKDIRDKFVRNVSEDHEFYEKIKNFCARSKRRILWDDPERLWLVSELRFRLAEMSIDMLEPNLIILDEFQRFRNLLDPQNLEARLAHKLFQYENVKTLLLSATPYKMLSLDHERDDDHYPDFLKTLGFLSHSESVDSRIVIDNIKRDIQTFRQSLYFLGPDDGTAILNARDVLQSKLLKVMCRTERVGMTPSRDAMFSEFSQEVALEPRDLHGAVLADRVASSVGARDIIEYWKSSPYLINFLRRYEFRQKLEARCENAPEELI